MRIIRAIQNPIFIAFQADSPESLEFPIRANHPIRANRANRVIRANHATECRKSQPFPASRGKSQLRSTELRDLGALNFGSCTTITSPRADTEPKDLEKKSESTKEIRDPPKNEENTEKIQSDAIFIFLGQFLCLPFLWTLSGGGQETFEYGKGQKSAISGAVSTDFSRFAPVDFLPILQAYCAI